MAWNALIRTWNPERKSYDTLVLQIEEAGEPGCLIRLYDGEKAVGDAFGEDPRAAMARALEIARDYLKAPSITEDDLKWVQLT